MKLTDNIIDQLIQEHVELNEKSIPVKITLTPQERTINRVAKDLGLDSFKKLPGRTKKAAAYAIRSLATAGDSNPKEISSADIESAVEKSGDELNTLGRIKKFTDDSELSKSIGDEFSKVVKAKGAESGTIRQPLEVDAIDIEQVQSLTFPRVTQSDANIQAGSFLGSQNELMKSIFSEGTIKGRLEELTNISKQVLGKEPMEEPRKMLQYSMFMDLCNHYINESDSRSGGYLFESLCAQMCGGAVGGGSNGVADFTTGDGSKGSSKLYTNWRDIKQSAGDRSWEAGEAIHYVIGIKQAQKVNEDLKEGTKYVNVALHYIIVTKAKQEEGVATFVTSDANRGVLSIQKMPATAGNIIDVIKGATEEETKVGTLELYSGKNSFKQVLESKYKGKDTDTKKAFAAMKEFFKLLFEAEESTKEYIATNEPAKAISAGEKAQEKYAAAGPELNTVIDLLSIAANSSSEDKGSPESANPPQLQENEINLDNLLDKFIKEVILTK